MSVNIIKPKNNALPAHPWQCLLVFSLPKIMFCVHIFFATVSWNSVTFFDQLWRFLNYVTKVPFCLMQLNIWIPKYAIFFCHEKYLWHTLSNLVHFFVVSLFLKGEQMIPVLNAVDIRAAVYGNHEFGNNLDFFFTLPVVSTEKLLKKRSLISDNLCGICLLKMIAHLSVFFSV